MTTLTDTYCTYTVAARDLATVAKLGRKVRSRGGRRATATDYRSQRDMWRDHVMLGGCTAYAGDADDTFVTHFIGGQRDTLLVPVPYDIIAAATKGRLSQSFIVHSDGRLECADDTVYTWRPPTTPVVLPIDLAEIELSPVANIMAADYAEMIRITIPTCAKDDTRPVLTGVCLTPDTTGRHNVRAAATDSYRLVECKCDAFDIATTDRIVIRSRALTLAGNVKCDAYCIEANDDFVRIAPSSASPLPHPTRIYTRRIEGAGYPNVDALWPESFPARITLDGDAFVNAMRAADDMAGGVSVALHAQAGDTLRVELKGRDHSGVWFVPMYGAVLPEDIVIGVNPGFAADAAEAVITPGQARLHLHLQSPLRPMLFTPADDTPSAVPSGTRVLLMPMRT